MKKDTKPAEAAANPALIVFGLDDNQRPHASWFAEPDAELAEKAAGLMGLRVLRVTTPEHRAAALELAVGRVFASGKGFVPFCAAGLYSRLAAFEEAFTPEAPKAAVEPLPEPTNVPATWAEIGVNSLVLAAESESSGWYEAVTIEARDDLFGLRWRQWPDLPPFVRRREHLALLSAEAHTAVTETASAPAA